MSSPARLRWAILLLIFSPLMLLAAILALSLTDLAWLVFGRKREPATEACRRDAASVVIPNWNGRGLLEQYFPSVEIALAAHPDNEIILVDNGSSDGSADFVGRTFPRGRGVGLAPEYGFC